MSSWNYRIVQDDSEYFIAEVHYDRGHKPVDYYPLEQEEFSRQEDLITRYRLVGFALDRPYLRVLPDGALAEMLA